MADGPEEEYEGLFRKGGNIAEGINPTTTVASYQEQYQEVNMIF